MKTGLYGLAFLALVPGMAGGGGSTDTDSDVRREIKMRGPSFEDDLYFLREHKEVIVLSDESGQAQVAVVPDFQGRVMTSTAQGLAGASFGWLNRDLIASAELRPHINAFGGEDRFWMGPEGGQFAIFFAAGDPFDLEHWQPWASTSPRFDMFSTKISTRFRNCSNTLKERTEKPTSNVDVLV